MSLIAVFFQCQGLKLPVQSAVTNREEKSLNAINRRDNNSRLYIMSEMERDLFFLPSD